MGELTLSTATSSNLTDNVEDVLVDPMNTDGATGSKETSYICSEASQYWGYFNSLPALKSAILMKATWVVGKGYTTDPETQVILDHISGWGKDTFEDILFNMEVTKRIYGDAYAEIMRDEDSGTIINLKPLDPSVMRIVVDDKGIIKRYEQTGKNKEQKGVITFKPEEILHLSHNRLADQIHGISDIKALEKVILYENQSFEDMAKIMHRQAKPMIMFKLGTDVQSDIDAFIAKMDEATNKGENIYIPDDKNAVNFEVIQVNVSQLILEWRNHLDNKFYRALGMPMILFGSSGSTESGGKIEYTGHEQVWEHDQKQVERQLWEQLQVKIDLNSPTSLLENLKMDQAKDGMMGGGLGFQPNDVIAGSGK